MNGQVLRVHPKVLTLCEVLEQNGLYQQKMEVQSLVKYLCDMEKRLSVMTEELRELKSEVNKLENQSVRAKCQGLVAKANEKVQQAKDLLTSMKEKFLSSAEKLVETFQQKGRDALAQGIHALRIPSAIARLGQFFSHAAESMKQGANRLDAVREELHQTGTHARNAAGAMFGKSPQEAGVLEADHGILARVRNSMESCGKSFAEMEQNANHLAEQFRLEKPSVKSQLSERKSDCIKPRTISSAKEQAR